MKTNMKKFIYIDIIYNKKEYKQQQEKNCNTISQYVNVKKIKNENGLIKQYKKAIIKIDKKFRKIKKQNINDKTMIIPSLKVIDVLRKLTEKTDETEFLTKTAVLFRKLFKGMLGNKIFLPQIFQ